MVLTYPRQHSSLMMGTSDMAATLGSTQNFLRPGVHFNYPSPLNGFRRDTRLPPFGCFEEYNLYPNGRGFCNVCNFSFDSVNHAYQHLLDIKHKQCVELRRKIEHAKINNVYGLNSDQQFQAMMSNRQKNHSFSEESDCSDSICSGSSNKTSNADPEAIKLKYAQKGDQTQWIYCDLCQVCVNSAEQEQVHKMGKKHKQKEEALHGVDLVPKTTNPATIRPVGHGRNTPPSSIDGSKETVSTSAKLSVSNSSINNLSEENMLGLQNLTVPCNNVEDITVVDDGRIDEIAKCLSYLQFYNPFSKKVSVNDQ